MTFDASKAPFPWFGGKSAAAGQIWQALGDPAHYVEPFAGTLAVLLRRPHPANRTYFSETVNDSDGLLVNAWRSIQLSPDATADAASWPVSEADLHARHLALVRWRAAQPLERLMADPAWHDPTMGGWWLWGVSCWIGGGWCAGSGPWTERDGLLVKQDRQADRQPGITRERPHLSNDGQGVNAPQLREPGIDRKRPQLSSNGQGVNAPQLREPGIDRKRPHLHDNGQGVNHAGLRQPGVHRQLPHLGNDGRGVNAPQLRQPGWHEMTMPRLREWMRALSARLRHVRILNGDWQRTLTGSASRTLAVRSGVGPCGVFLDPPYGDVRADDLYAHDSFDLAAAVQQWCREHGPDPDYRIVLAGFDTEHATLEADGWTPVEWFKAGWLTGGMGNTNGAHQQQRERLWLSPHCHTTRPAQAGLFDLDIQGAL